MIATGKQPLETIGRFDMTGYRPPSPYLREMVRYGILKDQPAPDAAIDPYARDGAYWQSFHPTIAE